MLPAYQVGGEGLHGSSNLPTSFCPAHSMLIPKLDCHRPLVHSPSPGLTWPWNANFSHQEAPSTSFYKRYCKQFLDTWSRCFEITLLFTVCYSVIFLLVITPSAFCPSIQLAVIRMETMQSAGLERFSGSQKTCLFGAQVQSWSSKRRNESSPTSFQHVHTSLYHPNMSKHCWCNPK